MKWYRNLKLRLKLILAFLIVIAFTVTIGVVGIGGMTKIHSDVVNISRNYLPSVQALSAINNAEVAIQSIERLLAEETLSSDQRQEQYALLESQKQEIVKNSQIYEKFDFSTQERANGEAYKKLESAWLDNDVAFLEIAKQIDTATNSTAKLGLFSQLHQMVSTSCITTFDAMEKAVSDLTNYNAKESDDASAASEGTSSSLIQLMWVVLGFSVASAGVISIYVSSSISAPLRKLVEGANKLAEGNTRIDLKIDTKDEVGILAKSFDKVIAAIQLLIADANMLSHAAMEGRLSVRADATQHQGDYRAVVEGVNATLDAVVSPLNVAADTVQRISQGDIPEKITDSYSGDFNAIKNNLNTCIDAVNLLVSDANQLSAAAVEGQLSTRADASRHQGDFRRVVEGVNATLDAVIGPLNSASLQLQKLANGEDQGDMDDDAYRGDFKLIQNSLNQVRQSLNLLLDDTAMLTQAAAQGQFNTRAELTRHKGGYADIVRGINNTLDAIVTPINEFIAVLNKLAVNDYTAKVEGSYEGMSQEMGDAINTTLTRLLSVQSVLEEIAVGDSGRLEYFRSIGKRSEHDRMVPAIISSMSTLEALVNETNRLSAHAVAGQLDARSDATLFQGKYRLLIEGINAMMSAVAEPVRQTAQTMRQISRGELPQVSTEGLQGEYLQMAQDLATCTSTLRSLIEQMNGMSREHDAGDIDVRLDAALFEGAYRQMAQGINAMVEGHIAVKKKAMACVAEFGRGNFDAPLERFPGKKAFINENIEQVRVNLKALIEDANRLADAATEGNLAIRADASRQQGDFQSIIGGMNNMLDAIEQPLNEAQTVLGAMAGNDYTLDMSTGYNGSFRTLAESVNRVQETLNDVLGDLSSTADQVANGTRQVSDGSQALSQGATEQASAIEELNASVSEIAAQTKLNATNANQANSISITARESALLGNAQMKEMLQSMTDINESSNSISRIIKVIDDIAFQTNLLALNAAVEAARAGQHGKGFAVVAEEVRNLAARSADAARETTAMIEGSIKKVEDGTRIAKETAQALGKIVEGVEKSTDLVSSIAKASSDQATAVAQVNRGIEQVSQVVQTNSATAEESAATSEELSSQAELLKQMVAQFRLKDQGGTKVLPHPAALPQGSAGSAKPNRPRISLNDREFGKY